MPAEGPGESLSPDDLFELLSHHRRRYVIECLDQYGSPMSLPDLADECVVMEHQAALDDIPAETVKRMYMALYHCHIPKLVEAAAVEYDQESDSVAVGPTAPQLESHLTLARSTLSSTTATALETLRGTIIEVSRESNDSGDDDGNSETDGDGDGVGDGDDVGDAGTTANDRRYGYVDDNKGLTIEQARQALQRAGHDEENAVRMLNRLENTGYIHFVNGHLELIS